MEEMVNVPLRVFYEGMEAKTKLNAIRSLVSNGNEYCSSGVMTILGLDAKSKKEVQDVSV